MGTSNEYLEKYDKKDPCFFYRNENNLPRAMSGVPVQHITVTQLQIRGVSNEYPQHILYFKQKQGEYPYSLVGKKSNKELYFSQSLISLLPIVVGRPVKG